MTSLKCVEPGKYKFKAPANQSEDADLFTAFQKD